MTDTLRSLAGTTFSTTDVIKRFQLPVPLEELVLDRYVFLPHVRTGIAAALNRPFTWTAPATADVTVTVPVHDDRGALPATMPLHVHGPGSVKSIPPQQVIRAFPKADAVDAEVDDLAHVEFDRPDLPWLFTPTGPDAAGHLTPWITLVVAERRRIAWGERRGFTRLASIRRDQLQPLGDAWAWAHAQVIGAKGDTPTSEPTLERRLGAGNAAHNLSRLVCPRRLDDHTAYVACVVPTFLTTVRAAFGLAAEPTLAPAWGTAADFTAGDPLEMVDLPVFYSWEFGTGPDGNFESLARLLKPAVAPPGVGRRRVDASRPWADRELAAADPGAEIVVTGPVVSPQQPSADLPVDPWPTEEQQQWAPPVRDELIQKLNLADQQAHAPDPGPPLVGPPLYGSAHARQRVIETAAPQDADQPQWFRELNTDPRLRIVGGLGTRVVQAEQEDLMASAWNQVMGVEAANRALRMAQFAQHVSASLHRRHLTRLTAGEVLAVTERVHAKVLDQPLRSVWATVDSSTLPTAVTTGAFRRLARVRGPVVRASITRRADRVSMVESLTVTTDLVTADWVRRYRSPDGIDTVGPALAARLTDTLAAEIAPGSTRDELLARWTDDLAKPAAPERLSPELLDAASVPAVVDVSRELWGGIVRRILGVMPSPDETEQSGDVAVTAVAQTMLLRGLLDTPGAGEFELLRAEAERLRLEVIGETGPDTVLIGQDAVILLGRRAVETAERHQMPLMMGQYEREAGRLRELLEPSFQVEGGRAFEAIRAIGDKVINSDGFAEATRTRIEAPTATLVAALDPKVTVPARIKGRLTGGSGRLPSWLRPDWFDDRRVEPVMAHPRFTHPMYEPLHRYDPEWMVPGLGLIAKPDMATLLQTNNQFIEGYLVGLNHEMGRELLWREYPTDQRGTYFSSFWTHQPEIVADLHQAAWRTGALKTHMTTPDGQIVFLVRGDLVRRYPGVVAHAALEGASDPDGIPSFRADRTVETLFHVHLAPNVLLVGFRMTVETIRTPGEKWWFTLSENPGEPRFGLDPSRSGGLTRDNLVWTDFGVDRPGMFLDATRHTDLTFTGVPGPAAQRTTWGASSAQVAFLLFQLPARAAFSAEKMVQGAMH